MREVLVLIVIFLGIIACKMEREPYDNFFNEKNHLESNIQGHMKWNTHQNEKVIQKINDKNNKREGLYSWYYQDGKIEQRVTYKAGKREGQAIWYYNNGNIKKKVNYKRGKLEGEYFVYDKNGSIKTTLYFKNNQLILKP